jgi:hypothetical protein
MTTESYLWLILALLSVALVLVIVTARRGPWSNKLANPDAPIVLRSSKSQIEQIKHVRIVRDEP